ncbi:hypothetical protein ACU4GD_34505 [Cupriavidus basilensis]
MPPCPARAWKPGCSRMPPRAAPQSIAWPQRVWRRSSAAPTSRCCISSWMNLGLELDRGPLAGVRDIAVRLPAATTATAAATAQRFRLEAYPLAGMLLWGRLRLDEGDDPGHYAVQLDGGVAHRVFVAASGVGRAVRVAACVAG